MGTARPDVCEEVAKGEEEVTREGIMPRTDDTQRTAILPATRVTEQTIEDLETTAALLGLGRVEVYRVALAVGLRTLRSSIEMAETLAGVGKEYARTHQ